VFAVAALAAAILPSGAAAAPRATPAPTRVGTQQGNAGVTEAWSLAPTGTDPLQPGSRPTFTYALAPGATLDDSLTVWNYSNTQLTFHVYATDALNNADGAFDLIDPEQKPKDVGSWITLEQSYVTLPPARGPGYASKIDIGVKIHVPDNADPGDHSGGIVAASRTPATTAEGKHIVLDRRVGSRMYLRVNGPVRPELVVENVNGSYGSALNPLDGGLDVEYTVRNTGNVRLGFRPTVDVGDVFGSVGHAKGHAIAELLPGNAVTLTQHFDGVAATLWETSDVRVAPFIPRGTGVAVSARLRAASATTHTLAVPWLLVAILAALAVAILYARRRRHPQQVQGPGGGDGGPPGPSPRPPVMPSPSVREAVGAGLRASALPHAPPMRSG
jgi:hypothetical protein